MDLQDIEKGAIKSRDTLPTGQTLLDDDEIFWLIQQAKKAQSYEKALKDIEGAYEEDLSHVQACRKMVRIATKALSE